MHSAPAHVPKSLVLQVVEVREVSPPKGETPIVWRLLTTEPVDTKEQVASVVDAYRQRWLIEEYFKAIKTGCRYQDLQLEDIHGLLVALAIHAAVAWRLLLIRWVAHHQPEAPATSVLPATHVKLLSALTGRSPVRATAKAILYSLAQLGGHLKNNGPPGWLALQRGYEQLLIIHRGWALAHEQ